MLEMLNNSHKLALEGKVSIRIERMQRLLVSRNQRASCCLNPQATSQHKLSNKSLFFLASSQGFNLTAFSFPEQLLTKVLYKVLFKPKLELNRLKCYSQSNLLQEDLCITSSCHLPQFLIMPQVNFRLGLFFWGGRGGGGVLVGFFGLGVFFAPHRKF